MSSEIPSPESIPQPPEQTPVQPEIKLVEDTFQAEVTKQLPEWHKMIDHSHLERHTKQAFKDILACLEDWQKNYKSIKDAIINTNNQLLDAVSKDKNEDRAHKLFEDIRDQLGLCLES